MLELSKSSLRTALRHGRTSPPASSSQIKFEHLDIRQHDDGAPDANINTPEGGNGTGRRIGTKKSTRLNRPARIVEEHPRPSKKVKLDDHARDLGNDNTNGLRSPEPPGKFPLRSRDVQARKAEEPIAARKSRRALDSSVTFDMPAPSSTTAAASPMQQTPTRISMMRNARVQQPLNVSEDTGHRAANGVSQSDTTITNPSTTRIAPPTHAKDTRKHGGGEKRALRSHDGGSRSKSELALYFANYEQIVSLDPVKSEFLSPDTTIFLVNDLSEPLDPFSFPPRPEQSHGAKSHPSEPKAINPLENLHDVQVIELPTPTTDSTQPNEDPLSDAVYFKAHRRMERQEKQLRNIERDRAQHEKIQLERILSELQGHDWLRVMGISGITDSEKKLYEPKRAYFVKEVSTLIDKFRAWKEEEKRRRMEKEQALETEDEEEAMPEAEVEDSVAAGTPQVEATPPDTDVDAAHQLHVEAMTASRKRSKAASSKAKQGKASLPQTQPQPAPSNATVPSLTLPPRPPPPPPEPEPAGPFTSFYAKPHLRAAALGRNRRGRARSAFGRPLPEMTECEFHLPDGILTEDAILAARRRNRLRRREQKRK